MRRASAFLLRVLAGLLAAAADHLEPAEFDESDVVLEPEPIRAPLPDEGEWRELPWPERRQSCVNYPHEAYYSG